MGRPALPHRNSKAYWAWNSMKSRCQNPNHQAWEHYGARGITVCERWQSFDNFLADMGHAPEGLSLDRIDNDQGYEPGNCRWATPKQQKRNQRTNHQLSWRGKTLSVTEWAEDLGISREVIFARLRNGWPIQEVLGKPVRAYSR